MTQDQIKAEAEKLYPHDPIGRGDVNFINEQRRKGYIAALTAHPPQQTEERIKKAVQYAVLHQYDKLETYLRESAQHTGQPQEAEWYCEHENKAHGDPKCDAPCGYCKNIESEPTETKDKILRYIDGYYSKNKEYKTAAQEVIISYFCNDFARSKPTKGAVDADVVADLIKLGKRMASLESQPAAVTDDEQLQKEAIQFVRENLAVMGEDEEEPNLLYVKEVAKCMVAFARKHAAPTQDKKEKQ